VKRIDGFLHSTPAVFLAFGLFFGIILGSNLQIFNFSLNLATVLIIVIALIFTNRYSKILSAVIAVCVGVIFQNSWQASMEQGEKFFSDGDKIKISVDFYSPPTFQSEKEMTQLATIVPVNVGAYCIRPDIPLNNSPIPSERQGVCNTPLQFTKGYRINLIFPAELTTEILTPAERAEITGIFRCFDTQNTAAPWEFDNIFQAKIKNTIGEIEIISIEKEEKIPFVADIYRHIRRNFEGSRYNSLYISLFTGDRSNLSPHIRAFFRESGLVHFLAISGLHIAILITALSLLVWFLPLPKLVRRCMIAASILFLPFLVGFGPPTLRAVIMGLLLTISQIFNRKSNPVNSLFVAAFFILAIYPMHIFLIGFQYSFVATFAVLLFPKMIGERKYKNEIIFLMLPIFLFIATTPIQIFHFATITWASIIANIIMLPVLTIICQIALISVFVSAVPIFEFVARLMVSFCDKVLDILFFAINRFVLLSGMGENYTQISPFIFILLTLLIMILCCFPKRGIIYSIYLLLAFFTVWGIVNLFKSDTVYTVSSQNLRMKVYCSAQPAAIIIGGAQSRLYYNPQILRWLHNRLDGRLATPLIITDSSYIPPDVFDGYNHIILRNSTGEIKFDVECDEHKTVPVAIAETRRRRTQTPKIFERQKIR